jgi:hypothetical protein
MITGVVVIYYMIQYTVLAYGTVPYGTVVLSYRRTVPYVLFPPQTPRLTFTAGPGSDDPELTESTPA